MVPVLQAAAQQGGIVSMVLPIALIFVIFYVFIIRPQNKKQKETQKMIDALKKGDKVVTIGGIHGVISSVKDQTVIVKVDDDAKIEFTRSAIASVIVDKPAKEKEEAFVFFCIISSKYSAVCRLPPIRNSSSFFSVSKE